MKRVYNNIDMLETVSKLPSKTIPKVIPHMDKNFIKTIAEINSNVLKGNIPLEKQDVKRLQHYKQCMRQIDSCCSQKKINTEKVGKVISNQTGGFLPVLLSTVIPLLLKGLVSGAAATTAGLAINKIANG